MTLGLELGVVLLLCPNSKSMPNGPHQNQLGNSIFLSNCGYLFLTASKISIYISLLSLKMVHIHEHVHLDHVLGKLSDKETNERLFGTYSFLSKHKHRFSFISVMDEQ